MDEPSDPPAPPAPLACGAALIVAFVIGVGAALVHLVDVSGFVIDRGAGHFAEPLLHQPADLELHGAFLGHGDWLERLGVLRLTCLAELGLEDAEVAELQTVTPTELVDDLVEELLDHLFDQDATAAGGVRDPVNQFFLRDRRHSGPRRR